jgi:hypothetical protein
VITLKETKEQIEREPRYWCIHLMNFVDDFRYYKDIRVLAEPFVQSDRRVDALLASTAEALCDELKLTPPQWLSEIPACSEPYFVGEIEGLKAISVVESPLRFRMRNIFVLENFLSRV